MAIPCSHVNRIKSTQSYAKRRKEIGHIYVARGQGNAYGRKGDQWISPYNCGLYMSIRLPGIYEPEQFMTAMKEIVRSKCQKYTEYKLKTSPTNDVYYWDVPGVECTDDTCEIAIRRKLAGVIAEVHGGVTIVGIGINIQMHNTTARYGHLYTRKLASHEFESVLYHLSQSIAFDILFHVSHIQHPAHV